MEPSRIKNPGACCPDSMRDNLHGIDTSHRLLNITLAKSLNEIIVAKDWPIGDILHVKFPCCWL